MMEKGLDFIKKYKFAIITAMVILIVGSIIFCFLNINNKKATLKELDESNYYFCYDSTWKIDKKENDSIILKHNSGSKVTIQISTLTDEYRYATMDELIDELLYNLEQQNPDYKLLSKKQDKITKYEFDGYKLLYENNKEQVMINVYKKSDQLVIIRYEAENDYFDILLDSVHSIIYNLNIKDENFDLKNNLQLDIADAKYSKSEEVDNAITTNTTYEIASNHYYVEYSIPSSFKLRKLDSSNGKFELVLDSGEIVIDTYIWNKNIYEYLDKEATGGVYSNYNYYRDDEDYSNFEETLTKLESNYDSYIYKNSYIYNRNSNNGFNLESTRNEENVELIYALNNCHILVISVEATGVPITEKLIHQIQVNTSKNYASYVKVEKDNNLLIGTLQRFSDYKRDKIDYITLKVPDKYEEIDENRNIYLERTYALNYNEDMLIYDYKVHYKLTELSAEDIIDTFYLNPVYGEFHELTYSGDLTLNGKVFKVYDGGYTDISGIMFTNINRKKYYVNKKVLVYEIPENGSLYIEIDGNGKGLGDDIINELTNFTFEVRENE